MTTVSLRISEQLLTSAESYANFLQIPRAEYIRRAIVAMNDEVRTQTRRERLIAISKRVAAQSSQINAEFAAIEDAPHA